MKIKTQFQTYLPEEIEDRVVDYLLGLKRQHSKKVQQRFLNEMLIGVFLHDWIGFRTSNENEIINLSTDIDIISNTLNWSIQLQDETQRELVSYKSEINKRLIHENPKHKIISAQKITSAIFQHVFCESFDQKIFNILKEALITFYDTETPPWTSEKNEINHDINCLKLNDFFNPGYPFFNVQDERIIKLFKRNLAILGVSEKDLNSSIKQSLIESIYEYKKNELSSTLEDYYEDRSIEIKLFVIDERLAKLLAISKAETIRLSLTEISENNASILSNFSGDGLVLDLQELSPEVAKSLSKFKGLYLNLHLKRLDFETAQQLVNFKGTELAFDGINKIESKVAYELSKFKGSLVIDDLATIGAQSAHELSLSKHVGKLVLGGPFKLENKSAKSLAKLDGDLWLCDIKEIDEEIAECLSNCSGSLALDGIKKIEPNPAKWLAKTNSILRLNGLQNIDESVAKNLAENKGELRLNGIKKLDDNVARILAEHGSGRRNYDFIWREIEKEAEITSHRLRTSARIWGLRCERLFRINVRRNKDGDLTIFDFPIKDEEEREALRRYIESRSSRPVEEENWGISLNGLKKLNDNTAKYLSTYQGSLWLDGLDLISETAAEILSKHKGEILGLNGLNKLSESVAKSLSGHQGKTIGLNGLTQIDQGIAGILSDYAGCLGLCGLTHIDDCIAAVLSKHKGDIGLTGLVALSDKAISHFINFEFDLGLKEEIKIKLDQLKKGGGVKAIHLADRQTFEQSTKRKNKRGRSQERDENQRGEGQGNRGTTCLSNYGRQETTLSRESGFAMAFSI